MKKILPLLFLLIITSCSVNDDELIEMNGIMYETESDRKNYKGFTGTSYTYSSYGTNEISLKKRYVDGFREGWTDSYSNGRVVSKRCFKWGRSEGFMYCYDKYGD
jgi:hypothetical protein